MRNGLDRTRDGNSRKRTKMADVPVPQRAVHRLELKGAGLPVQRVGQPKDAAAVYIFAMENPYVTGQVLFVDGGALLT